MSLKNFKLTVIRYHYTAIRMAKANKIKYLTVPL